MQATSTRDVAHEPAAGFFCCETFGDVFRCDQHLPRRGESKRSWSDTRDGVFAGLTAEEVSSGSRIRMALGLFSLQNLQKADRKQHIRTREWNWNWVGFFFYRVYLLALSRASSPSTHS